MALGCLCDGPQMRWGALVAMRRAWGCLVAIGRTRSAFWCPAPEIAFLVTAFVEEPPAPSRVVLGGGRTHASTGMPLSSKRCSAQLAKSDTRSTKPRACLPRFCVIQTLIDPSRQIRQPHIHAFEACYGLRAATRPVAAAQLREHRQLFCTKIHPCAP